MQLTKYAHACVTLDQGTGGLVVDPGTFTPNTAELLASAGTVLVTHEHFDHVDEAALTAALDARPELRVYGPAAIVAQWQDRGERVTAVVPGDRFTAEGFAVEVFGGTHARIHADIPQVANVGYLFDGRLYHPGDAYYVPAVAVETLLLPSSGPWTKVGEAADFVRGVKPERVVQIHEIMLSEIGQQSVARIIGQLTEVPVTIVPAGESISV